MKTLRRHPVQRPSNGFLCPTQNGVSAFGGLARAIGRWEGTRGGSRVPLGCTGLDPPLVGPAGGFGVPGGGGRELLSSCFPVSTLRFPELRVSASSTVKAEIHAGLRYYLASFPAVVKRSAARTTLEVPLHTGCAQVTVVLLFAAPQHHFLLPQIQHQAWRCACSWSTQCAPAILAFPQCFWV